MANPSIEWTKVLIHPLGLAGYVLFLLFGLVARAKRRDERRWILPAAFVAAGIALLGGLGLAYQNIDREAHEKLTAQPTPSPTPTAQVKQDIRQVTQTSTGDCNPNVISAGTVTVNCSDKGPQPKNSLRTRESHRVNRNDNTYSFDRSDSSKSASH